MRKGFFTKFTSLVLIAILSFTLVACNTAGTDSTEDATSEATEQVSDETTEEVVSSESTTTTLEETTQAETEETTAEATEEVELEEGVKVIETVVVDNLEPITLSNDTGLFTNQQIADYIDEFLTLLREGDVEAIRYLSYAEDDTRYNDDPTNTYLPSVFADEEAREVAVNYFNRMLVDAPNYSISDFDGPLDSTDMDVGDKRGDYFVYAVADQGYLGLLNSEELLEQVDTAKAVPLNQHDTWKPVFDYLLEKIDTNELAPFRSGELRLIKNEDGSLSIDSDNFHHSLLYVALPFAFDNAGNLIWDYEYIFEPFVDVANTDASAYSEYPKLTEYLDLYNTGDYLGLYDLLEADMGDEFELSSTSTSLIGRDNSDRNKVAVLGGFYQEKELKPQIHISVDGDNIYMLGSSIAVGQYTPEGTVDTHYYVAKHNPYDNRIELDDDEVEESIQEFFYEMLEEFCDDIYADDIYVETIPEDYFR